MQPRLLKRGITEVLLSSKHEAFPGKNVYYKLSLIGHSHTNACQYLRIRSSTACRLQILQIIVPA